MFFVAVKNPRKFRVTRGLEKRFPRLPSRKGFEVFLITINFVRTYKINSKERFNDRISSTFDDDTNYIHVDIYDFPENAIHFNSSDI